MESPPANVDEWVERIEAIGPASLLVAIERRLGQTLRDRVSAEDILQEALLSACREVQRLEWRGHRQFRSWLLRVIEHRIADEARRQERGERRPRNDQAVDDAFAAAVAQSTTPSRLAVYREQAGLIRQALERLPEPERRIVCARVIDQRPLAAIAEELGLTVGVVRQRFRAGAELYQIMLHRGLASGARATSEAQ